MKTENLIAEMPDEELHALEERLILEHARRHYNEHYLKEKVFRDFCQKLKFFLGNLEKRRQEEIRRICEATPLPTLDEYLQIKRNEIARRRREGRSAVAGRWSRSSVALNQNS